MISINIDSSLAKRISFLLGAILSFTLNKKVTFRSNSKELKEPITFIIIYLISFMGNSIIHDHLIDIYINNLAFVISTCFSILFNFLGQKFIVFNK